MIPERRPLLIVSLPRNDPALARAATDGGADVLKVHVNVRHLASGTVFGTLAEERTRLEQILAIGLPTGLVPGEAEMLAPEEMPEIRRMGFAFLDAFIDTIRPHLYEAGIPVVPPEGYGKPPEKADLDVLRRVGEATRKKLIVPTQRRLAPDDAGRYFEIRYVTALMIGAIVTGLESASLGTATAAFRRALDRVSPWR